MRPEPTEYDLAQPWVRQPCDSDLSFALFQEYLHAPLPRRLADLARRPGILVSLAQLREMARCDGWEERAQAWDDHLSRCRLETVERVVKETAAERAERQAGLARKLQRMGEREIDRLLSILERPDNVPGTIRPNEAIRAVVQGIKAEKLALGETLDEVKPKGPDYSALSVDELRALRVMQQKVSSENG